MVLGSLTEISMVSRMSFLMTSLNELIFPWKTWNQTTKEKIGKSNSKVLNPHLRIFWQVCPMVFLMMVARMIFKLQKDWSLPLETDVWMIRGQLWKGSEPKAKQWSGTTESSSRLSIHLDSDASDEKHSRVFHSSSPVSVLENSSSSLVENPISYYPKFIPVKRPRNKRPRPSNFNPCRMIPFITSTFSGSRSHSLAALESESETYYAEKTLDVAKKKQKKKKNLTLLSCTSELEKSSSRRPSSQPPGPTRKCTHCEVTKTPQWREGPLGPKTLCNACGVRYRSGRLLPEYRPAASPTFVPSLHSNSHKKVVEMRTIACQLPNTVARETTMASSG
ncbi:GATA transcription factor 11-like isoform X1 [Tripterygium wilfordii]|uniref:GATA transcription factor 11-like isoform X1 n=1 Tax=Tripterygium wilfordii TaxID=458696 RepID=UPI0018F86356|nr:GATA transcription factor 11-like isoform X1 [Tripterygium wilfordii]XP_038719704.1 GATA transcription factor 11-like isoform X1 [Tripterygium wilfordii]